MSDGDDNLYDGTVTFSRTSGTGVFQIIAMYACDFEIGPNGTDNLLATFIVEGGNLVDENGNEFQNLIADTTSGITADDCVYLFYDNGNNAGATSGLLLGDENNDVVLVLDEADTTNDDDTDGATLIAYISGLDAAGDIAVTDTTDDA